MRSSLFHAKSGAGERKHSGKTAADALAAVMVPSARKAGLRDGIFSGETFIGCSSFATTRSPPLSGTSMGAISAANAPLSTAFLARVSVSTAYASWSPRVNW